MIHGDIAEELLQLHSVTGIEYLMLLGQHQNPTPWITCGLYKGTQWVSKMQSNFDGNGIIIECWLTRCFCTQKMVGILREHSWDVSLLCIQFIYYVTTIEHYLNTAKRLQVYIHVHYY